MKGFGIGAIPRATIERSLSCSLSAAAAAAAAAGDEKVVADGSSVLSQGIQSSCEAGFWDFTRQVSDTDPSGLDCEPDGGDCDFCLFGYATWARSEISLFSGWWYASIYSSSYEKGRFLWLEGRF